MKTIGKKTLIEMMPLIKRISKNHGLKPYNMKDFKKIIEIIKKIKGLILILTFASCTHIESNNKHLLKESIYTVQDMRAWMIEDQQNEIINFDYAEYYIEYLGKVEDNLLKIENDGRF